MPQFAARKGKFVKNFIIGATLLALAGLWSDARATSFDMADELTHVVPRIRSTALLPSAPASIPAAALIPFAITPMLVDHTSLSDAPRIVAAQEQRNYFGRGDKIHVVGELNGLSEFRLGRRGRKLIDPFSHEYLGEELVQLGTARLLAATSPGLHSLLIVDATREILTGDYVLAPSFDAPLVITPHLSPCAINAAVVSVPEGVGYAAQSQIVAINKGVRNGVATGVQLSLYAAAHAQEKATRPIDRKAGHAEQTAQLPAEESARLLIIRVFDRVSYGLITHAREPVQVGDKALTSWQEQE